MSAFCMIVLAGLGILGAIVFIGGCIYSERKGKDGLYDLDIYRLDKARKEIEINGVTWEECSAEEWDKLMESEREFIKFDDRGFIYARRKK